MSQPRHPLYALRAEPLARCPQALCRRKGQCRRGGTAVPCLMSHEPVEGFRWRLASKLADLGRDFQPRRTSAAPDAEIAFERSLARVKAAFERRIANESGDEP
jgi:hypothetical protein